MTQSKPGPARLIEKFLPLLQFAAGSHGVLDLACGSGRNGLFLVKHNLPVIFADINPAALKNISNELIGLDTTSRIWEVDFEDPESEPLAGKKFDAVLVFNYLHRPLIREIRNCLASGGLLFYETFTIGQAAIGRPSNPEYLLHPGELRSWFEDWEILHYSEGEDPKPRRYYANLVARKPAGRDHMRPDKTGKTGKKGSPL